MISVRGACRCVSLPGETWRIPVSTSAKPCSSNQARTALVIALRAIRNGLRSACRVADHHGDGWSVPAISNGPPPDAAERRPRESMNEFRESANIIDIIRLSLHRYGKPQEAARFRCEVRSFHVESRPACPCECRRTSLNLLVFASHLKLRFNAFGIGRRNHQLALPQTVVSRCEIGLFTASGDPPERRQNAGIDGQNQYVAARNRLYWPHGHPCPDWPKARNSGKQL